MATVVMRARTRYGEPAQVEIAADHLVVREASGAEVRVARDARSVVATEVSAPRMTLRPGLRVPGATGRAKVLWFDRPHDRDRAIRALVHAGWLVRPRRWPLVVGMVVAAAVSVFAVTVAWPLALIALAVAGGCLLQWVRNERAVRIA